MKRKPRTPAKPAQAVTMEQKRAPAHVPVTATVLHGAVGVVGTGTPIAVQLKPVHRVKPKRKMIHALVQAVTMELKLEPAAAAVMAAAQVGVVGVHGAGTTAAVRLKPVRQGRFKNKQRQMFVQPVM